MLCTKYTVEKENIHPFDIYESNGNGEKNKIRVDEPSIFNRLVVGLFPQNIGMYMSTLLLLATAFYSYVNWRCLLLGICMDIFTR